MIRYIRPMAWKIGIRVLVKQTRTDSKLGGDGDAPFT